jgi:DNA invertase Pin-like site-specific DNA recombinase
MPSRAALYLRVSTDKQSTANQRPEVEQLVRARGFEVVHAYEEQASAAKHRPKYEAMLKDARRGKFSGLGRLGLGSLRAKHGRQRHETVGAFRPLGLRHRPRPQDGADPLRQRQP